MANLHQLLKAMIEKGASDLHITTSSPPQLRIDGKLHPLKMPPLSPPETKQLCYSILTDSQKHKFEESNELDLSFGVRGLSRFRANIFTQRGAARLTGDQQFMTLLSDRVFQHLETGGLAGPLRADKARYLAGLDAEAHPLQRGQHFPVSQKSLADR